MTTPTVWRYKGDPEGGFSLEDGKEIRKYIKCVSDDYKMFSSAAIGIACFHRKEYRDQIRSGDWIVYVDLQATAACLAVKTAKFVRRSNKNNGIDNYPWHIKVEARVIVEFCSRDLSETLKKQVCDGIDFQPIEENNFCNSLETLYRVLRCDGKCAPPLVS